MQSFSLQLTFCTSRVARFGIGHGGYISWQLCNYSLSLKSILKTGCMSLEPAVADATGACTLDGPHSSDSSWVSQGPDTRGRLWNQDSDVYQRCYQSLSMHLRADQLSSRVSGCFEQLGCMRDGKDHKTFSYWGSQSLVLDLCVILCLYNCFAFWLVPVLQKVQDFPDYVNV